MGSNKKKEEDGVEMEVVSQLNPVTKAFLAGSLSGTCSTLLFQPLDLVKTRQQVGGRLGSSSMLGIAQSIVRAENVTGLWRGLWPSVCRTVPGVGIYFSSVHWMRSQLGGRKPTTTQVTTSSYHHHSISNQHRL